MKYVLDKICAALLCLCLLIAFVPSVSAAEAVNITDSTAVSGTGYDSFSFLTDGNPDSYRTSGSSAAITLKNEAGMAGLYLLFDLEYGSYTLTDAGSGKTFTMANIIAAQDRPVLVLSHNKTLAAQLYSELKSFFPHNAVEYFVSYFDYYQPEAYIASTDTYIEKDSAINEEIDRLCLNAGDSQ